MDSDGDEDICELFYDSDFGDNEELTGFVSNEDNEVLEAGSDDVISYEICLPLLVEKEVTIFSQMVGIIKNGNKNVFTKRKHDRILLSQP